MGATGGGGRPWWYDSPEIMDFMASLAATGYSYDASMEALEYQAQRDDADRAQTAELAQAELSAALEAANIAAGASRAASAASAAATTEAARMSAEAQKYSADQALAAAQERAEAARYAADQALEGVRLDTETRMKIAAGNLRLEAQKTAAVEFGAPSDWTKQVGFLRGMGMTRADLTPQAIRASGEALGPGPPDLGPAPQAVVGERGPELATATPQGMQVTPLDTSQAYHLRGQGVPGMQYGGTVGRLGQVQGGSQQIRPTATWAQEKARRDANWEAGIARMPAQVAQGRENIAALQAMTPQQQAAAKQRQAATQQQQFMQQLLGSGTGRTMQMPGGGTYLLSPAHLQARERLQAQQQEQQALQQAQEEMPAWFSQWLETQGGAGGGAAAPGATPGAGGAPTGPADANKMPFLETLRTGGYVPLYEGWGGPRTLPEAGITDPVKMPHEYNYADFARWTPTEQSMMFATWQALGMEPTTALEIMRRSAPRGSATASVGYG